MNSRSTEETCSGLNCISPDGAFPYIACQVIQYLCGTFGEKILLTSRSQMIGYQYQPLNPCDFCLCKYEGILELNLEYLLI
jgi:hypothetical protein